VLIKKGDGVNGGQGVVERRNTGLKRAVLDGALERIFGPDSDPEIKTGRGFPSGSIKRERALGSASFWSFSNKKKFHTGGRGSKKFRGS